MYSLTPEKSLQDARNAGRFPCAFRKASSPSLLKPGE